MTTAWAFIKLSRPHFLLGGAAMYAVGAVGAGVTSAGTYLLGQALVTCAQITAHYLNEYADVEFDRSIAQRTMFSGGSGVLSSGELRPTVALRAAQASTVLTIVFAGLVVHISVPGAVIGLITLAVSWGYSMPPIRLLDTGWGELITSVTVAGMVPVIGVTVNGGSITDDLLWIIAVLIPIHMAMMLAFELPDLESDRNAGKTVLAVRIGSEATTKVMVALFALACASGILGTILGSIDVAWPLAAAAVPAAVTVFAAHRALFRLLTYSAVATLVTSAAGVLISS